MDPSLHLQSAPAGLREGSTEDSRAPSSRDDFSSALETPPLIFPLQLEDLIERVCCLPVLPRFFEDTLL